jgi:DNA-binding response OmpR family regulator
LLLQEGVKRLLILDDDIVVISALSRYFALQGYQVVSAREREEAETLLGRETIDLAVLDVSLTPAGREGLEVLTAIRASNPWLPVVIFSGGVDQDLEAEARRLGADAVLGKRQLGELSRVVHDLLGRARPRL